ncbi:cytochrome P450 [Cercophora newfieldiana]|uniref:Cytochrome P450 n=1 Tax=Cercophora newfieldiana TaxID=92897 RepID=A0AA39YAD1_9PEZI|nr:cytochrome P450 [Cercophora newfieldiana]
MNNLTLAQGHPATVQHLASAYTTIKTTELGITHVILVIFAISFTNFINMLWKKRNFLLFAKSAKCYPVPQAANRFPMPWSLNRKYEVYKGVLRGNLFDNHFRRMHEKYSNTHAIVSAFTGQQKGINTIEPENFKSVLGTNFDDYKRSKYRLLAAAPMMPPGILTLDGHEWSHWRSLIRTQFTRKNFDANIADSERHMQLTFKAFGPVNADGWTGEVNLMDHVYRLSMDTVTQFLFGHSAETQSAKLIRLGLLPAPSSAQPFDLDNFAETFAVAAYYVGHRIKLSNMYFLLDSLAYRRACRSLRRMTSAYISSTLSRSNPKGTTPTSADADNAGTSVITSLFASGATLEDITTQVTHLLVAGMDTSSATLGWIFAVLAEHPEKYAKLRGEVVSVFGTEESRLAEFDLERLKTWLDGREPVAVRKGARVQLGVYLAHRRKDIWGEDAEEFRPERWEGRRRGWDFTPFSGGPQICIGQGYSVAQLSFAIARIVMRYDRIEKVEGANNLKQGWQSVLTPAEGVRLRMHLAEGSKPLEV